MTRMRGRGWLLWGLTALLVLSLVVGLVSNFTGSATPAMFKGVLVGTPLLLLAVHWLARPLNRLTSRGVAWLVAGGSLVMLIGQLLILSALPVTVYHDPFRIIAQAAHLAAGHPGWTSTYFWRYSQNAPVAIMLSWWLRGAFALGLSTNLALVILNLAMLDGTILLLVTTAWRLSHRASTTLGTLAFCVLTPFAYTYYLQVGYTDLPTLLVLALLVSLLWAWPQAGGHKRWLIGVALVGIAALGQVIKGNLIVILPASFLVLLGLWQTPGEGRRLVRPLMLIMVGVLLAFPLATGFERSAGFHHRKAIEFPLPAWIAMGYNQKTKGALSNADVNRNLHHRDAAARQKNDLVVIRKRLTQPGPVQLGRLLLAKLMILTNDANINFWYSGGIRAAPAWYLRHARALEGLVVVLYQSATCVLYLLVIQRLLSRQEGLTTPRGTTGAWLILLILGYLAFHVLLWEVEERYGQVLIPLLLSLLALTPVANPVPKRRWVLVGSVLAATWLSGITVNGIGLNSNLKSVTVAAQRGQLSAQYGAQPWQLRPGQQISQEIKLAGPINYFSVQVHQGSRLRVTLVSPHREITLRRRADCFIFRRPLPAGTYRVQIENRTGADQPVDVTRVSHYRLAPRPLVKDGRVQSHATLIYDAIWRTSK